MAGFKKIFVTGLTDVRLSTEIKDDLGDLRMENGKFYKYVQFDYQNTVTATSGDVLVYSRSTGYRANLISPDYSDASASAVGAGVAQALGSTTKQYMWIQLTGIATINTTLGGTATDGSPLTVIGAADKTMDLAQATAATETHFAHAEDASAKVVICQFPM